MINIVFNIHIFVSPLPIPPRLLLPIPPRLLLQSCAELRLPTHPSGAADAPAADWPAARPRELGVRAQPAPHPPLARLRHPAPGAWHPLRWLGTQREIRGL